MSLLRAIVNKKMLYHGERDKNARTRHAQGINPSHISRGTLIKTASVLQPRAQLVDDLFIDFHDSFPS
jgi:hypothetical protein